MEDKGKLHRINDTFGKVPEKLMHDINVTDGAVRLYSHMHWRYGLNENNHEGRASMGDILDISEATVTSRINELVAADWIVVEPQYENGERIRNVYHVFESQSQCRSFRDIDPKYAKPSDLNVEPRKSRRGVGGRPSHSTKETQVNVEDLKKLEFTSVENSSLQQYTDSLYTDSFSPANAGADNYIEEALNEVVAIEEEVASKQATTNSNKAKKNTSDYLNSIDDALAKCFFEGTISDKEFYKAKGGRIRSLRKSLLLKFDDLTPNEICQFSFWYFKKYPTVKELKSPEKISDYLFDYRSEVRTRNEQTRNKDNYISIEVDNYVVSK